MSKRTFGAILIALLTVGGGAAAWAHSDGGRPALAATAPSPTTSPGDRKQAMQKCLADSGVSPGDRPTPTQRQAVAKCLAAAGFTAPGKNGHGMGAGLPAGLGRVVHGDLIVRGRAGKFERVVYDRGTEKSFAGDKLTISRPDGVDVTVTVTKDTRFKGVAASQLKPGQQTLVVSDPAGAALMVGQKKAA